MKLILINPPLYCPTNFPYSLAAIKAELDFDLDEDILIVDLNASYHYHKFQEYYKKLKNDPKKYFELLEIFSNKVKENGILISKEMRENKQIPELKQLTKQILDQKPTIIAFSLSYNSQIFVTKQLIDQIQKENPDIEIIIGGPADYSKILEGVKSLPSIKEFTKYLISKGAKENKSNSKTKILADFSDFNKDHYFTNDVVYPIRTSLSCPYRQCTFCTHHQNTNFKMFDLSTLKETIQKNNIKKICFVDDDIPVPRIKEISSILKDLNVKWWCQLRPTKQIRLVLEEAKTAGLESVAWGVESGSQRILDLMNKGTKVEEVKDTLKQAKEIGIQNMLYIMFGFPTEKKEEFQETINFLVDNQENIDLISPSIFGLQFGSKIMQKPECFEIENVELHKRTYLSDKITFEVKSGLSTKETTKLLRENKHLIQQINKVPNIISVFKEQVLNK